ncbi:MAG: hypothetical protein ACXWQO_20255 [Bdellovibrionota bacterium]
MIEYIRPLIFTSVVIYFVFDFLEGRRLRDEREELIRLKSLELSHKASMATVTGLAFLYLFRPDMSALTPIVAFVIAALYFEMLGKIYFRWQL